MLTGRVVVVVVVVPGVVGEISWMTHPLGVEPAGESAGWLGAGGRKDKWRHVTKFTFCHKPHSLQAFYTTWWRHALKVLWRLTLYTETSILDTTLTSTISSAPHYFALNHAPQHSLIWVEGFSEVT